MSKRRNQFAAALLLILLAGATFAFAQDENVIVPEIIGLTPPEAAALLNEAGLRLGAETADGWTAENTQAVNTISAQSTAAGESVPAGTAIEITVLRIPSVSVVFDDNDITLINVGDSLLPLANIAFAAVDGGGQTFSARRIPAGALEPGDCMQVWSVGRSSPKDVPGCTGSTFWITTNNTAEHFWTGAGGTTQFTVTQDGVSRGMCGVANPGRCDLYLATGDAADTTPYVYFAYTTDSLTIYNRSESQFMTLPGLQLVDTNGTAFAVTETAFYTDVNPVADVARLAPGQCLFIGVSAESAPAEDCTVIAQTVVSGDAAFWRGDFTFTSVSDGQQRTCPGTVADRLTLCILPR